MPPSESARFGEFELIDEIRKKAPADPRVPLGIGDDAALVRVGAAGSLVTVDMLMEGTDFTFPPATPRLAGRKALAVNLSDIAAMAGTPTTAFVAFALPRGRGAEFARELQAGIEELAAEFDVVIAGGDTNMWDGPLVVSITVLGEPSVGGPVTRSGARPGDWLLCTGAFGGSIHGRHLTFTPRVAEARTLRQAADLHAMIDVSDGLAADLRHLLDESGVGAVLDADAIPIHADTSQDTTRPALDRALGDGEDFELVFAVSPEDGRRLLAHPPCATPLARLGEVTADRRVLIRARDGATRPLPRAGWTHQFAPAAEPPATK